MTGYIGIKNARIHNLRGVDVRIPRGKLTVITGVSGSGKSSLAFDTLYEEGRRRYLMFSGTQLTVDSVPSFDSITGLSPTVAVEQRVIRQSNPRSTVGTRTKLSAVLAVLFAARGIRDQEDDDGLPLSMDMFQRNSARGMCAKCLGSGRLKLIDEDALYGDGSLRVGDVLEGKLSRIGTWRRKFDDYFRHFNVSPGQTLSSLSEEQLLALKYGSPKTTFKGVNSFVPAGDRTHCFGDNPTPRQKLFLFEKIYARETACPKCGGTGLGIQASHTRFEGKTVAELEDMYLCDLHKFFLALSGGSDPVISDIAVKLGCMVDVGLGHLSLSRPLPTLSGGEVQRLFLASYIIAEMDSITFIFDEPTIGLHEVEKAKLISIIRSLADRGNTVVAVEHDENFMRAADWIIDLGPGAGTQGGTLLYEGDYTGFLRCTASKTAPYLSGAHGFRVKTEFRPADMRRALCLTGASLHNLRSVDAVFPLGVMVGVAGVSGSGKSSLISDTLVPLLRDGLRSRFSDTGDTDDGDADGDGDGGGTADGIVTEQLAGASLSGYDNIKKCFVIDQKPIGRSRTSCPATYTGIFDRVRSLFARESGLPAGMFSANSIGGCRVCHGDGVVNYHVGMGNFIEIECDACSGTGFVPEACETRVGGKSIRDILDMTVDEAAEYFSGRDSIISEMLSTLRGVGMGYIKLGQKTPTISGGESQRIKLARELAKSRRASGTLYILDEPTTGLSFSDSERLLGLLDGLVSSGGSVIVTEHDPFILSNCDYIIELGPGGGGEGGAVIASGTPAELKQNGDSIIGRYLK